MSLPSLLYQNQAREIAELLCRLSKHRGGQAATRFVRDIGAALVRQRRPGRGDDERFTRRDMASIFQRVSPQHHLLRSILRSKKMNHKSDAYDNANQSGLLCADGVALHFASRLRRSRRSLIAQLFTISPVVSIPPLLLYTPALSSHPTWRYIL